MCAGLSFKERGVCMLLCSALLGINWMGFYHPCGCERGTGQPCGFGFMMQANGADNERLSVNLGLDSSRLVAVEPCVSSRALIGMQMVGRVGQW